MPSSPCTMELVRRIPVQTINVLDFQVSAQPKRQNNHLTDIKGISLFFVMYFKFTRKGTFVSKLSAVLPVERHSVQQDTQNTQLFYPQCSVVVPKTNVHPQCSAISKGKIVHNFIKMCVTEKANTKLHSRCKFSFNL